jgi:hypothetical protein
MELQVEIENLSICRLGAAEAIPVWAFQGAFFSVTRTRDELSVVCLTENVPEGVKTEKDWRAIKVKGPLDFGLTGILSQLTKPLAEAGISIFAVSTFDTDYILVRANAMNRAVEILKTCGHEIDDSIDI